MLAVPIVRLDPELPLPAYAHPGDAGMDLRAREDGVVPLTDTGAVLLFGMDGRRLAASHARADAMQPVA